MREFRLSETGTDDNRFGSSVNNVLDRVQYLHQLWRHLGPEWLAYRVGYAARMRTGLLRRKMPATEWEEQPLSSFLEDSSLAEGRAYLDYRRSHAPAFFFASSSRAVYQQCFAAWDREGQAPVQLCEELAQGRLRYFEHEYAQTGFPPDWHSNPFTGDRTPSALHWSEIADFGAGDIKVIWEPSRFAFAYALVRAYWRTGDERYAEMFWTCVEDWRDRNPPQLGVNWKCGQEISFRVMAWCFGLYGFLDAQATTPERVGSLARMIAVSGSRIEANLDYALSQHNNHGISESVGLWTIGALFPEFRMAERWKDTGRRLLEDLGRDLIYDDGAFSQHSVNYHRVILHDYVWALRLGEVLNRPFSPGLKERVSTAVEWLYQIQDETSGQVPCYGQNDGALVLPLNNCGFTDFRPVVQAVRYLCAQTRRYGSGPWDEDLLWLFGLDAMQPPVAPATRADFQADTGGYYVLRDERGFAFVRCGSFRHRPGQADLLHVDLWWRGQNIAVDAGTYSYNAPEPWNNLFGSTAYHNTVTVDRSDQMDRAGRFLWLPWAHGHVRCFARSPGGHLAYWEGDQDGYLRLKSPVNQQRGILRLPDDSWLVLDRLTSSGDHRYRLHWLFADVRYQWTGGRLTLRTPAGPYQVRIGLLNGSCSYSLVRAEESGPRGWRSQYYNNREPALSMDAVAQASSLTFWSLFGPARNRMVVDGPRLRIECDGWQASLNLEAGEDQLQISSVILSGSFEDRMDVS